jgi:hypothetical protein
MNGYLMQEQLVKPGEGAFIESFSPENNYGVVFQDDGEAGYFYAVEKDPAGGPDKILDALHIYETDEEEGTAEDETAGAGNVPAASGKKRSAEARPSLKLMMIWSKDWLKCALVLDGSCHALFDFEAHGGYNINEFPPPNSFWTRGERKLTDEMIRSFF